ncbi:ribonuclease T2 family protein [Legionella cardiaca]|uniref:Ribonuclease T n=1 Tax=Legionella cardiaca TaxID=1071983 RepID=A0ABY8AR98_9GAMM|nr:ribonuclease T [Legionella cardiaca]WED43048.1 ribonuclease T [Legionella cardiaca]
MMIRLLALFWVVFPLLSFSSVSVDGSFEARKSCPVFLSKNKKTNPDNYMVQPSQIYVIKEVNRPIKPDWLRIELPNEEHSLRWVSTECGEYSFQARGKTTCEQLPGLADSYVLALSWQPGFCQTYGYELGKPECLKLTADSYQANHMVLHGLWPNQQICGEHYGFCGVRIKEHHCDYPEVNLSDKVAQTLRQFMPAYAAGSCLERHEWNKHGSCQTLSSDAYFALALRLNQEVNQTALGQFLHEHVGDTIRREELREKVRESFGKETSRKVYFGCKNGILVDIYIQLPALISSTESLAVLISKAPDFEHYDACPGNIVISDFNNDTWF